MIVVKNGVKQNSKLISKNANLIRQNKKEIQGIKADLSNTPFRREFEGLKAKVELHHPTN